MERDDYLVSICIPTYNRCEYLKSSLESLVHQEEFHQGLVEIVLCDNASTDDTREMVGRYVDSYENIHYYRNKENVGPTLNPKLASGLGKGTLLKLSGDDFIYEKNSLALFCYYAKKYSDEKPQLFFSNGTPSGNNFNGIQRVNFEYFVYSASYWMTWGGSYAVWRTDLDKYYSDNIGIEKECWQVRLYLDVMNEKDRGVIIGNRFTERAKLEKKNVNYDLYQVFYVNFLSMLQPFYESGRLSKSCIDWVKRDLLLNFFPCWVAGQELGIKGYSFYSKSLKEDVELKCQEEACYDIYQRNYRREIERLKAELP